MWWQVHKVLVASGHGARTGVSCGSTRSKKWHNLGNVSLCKNCRNSANKASGRCLRLHTLTSFKVIPQCLCRLKRSLHFKMLSSQRKEITVLHLLHSGKMKHASISSSIAGSRRKLSHESRRKGVASLLATLGEVQIKPMPIGVFSTAKVAAEFRRIVADDGKLHAKAFKCARVHGTY